jgi:mRNA interferase MazF
MIRGAVYPVDLGDAKRGYEQRGRRPGIRLRPGAVIAARDTRILAGQSRTIDRHLHMRETSG